MTRIPTSRELVSYARAEHASTVPAEWAPGAVVAHSARTATRTGAECAICGGAIWRGQRIATLEGRGDVAHIDPCIVSLAPGDPGAPAPDPALTAALRHHALA